MVIHLVGRAQHSEDMTLVPTSKFRQYNELQDYIKSYVTFFMYQKSVAQSKEPSTLTPLSKDVVGCAYALNSLDQPLDRLSMVSCTTGTAFDI